MVINTIRPWRWASRTRDTKENDIEKKLYNVCVCKCYGCPDKGRVDPVQYIYCQTESDETAVYDNKTLLFSTVAVW